MYACWFALSVAALVESATVNTLAFSSGVPTSAVAVALPYAYTPMLFAVTAPLPEMPARAIVAA